VKKLLLLFLILLPSRSFAQISISASLSRDTVSLNEPVELNVTVSGEVKNISEPDIPELENFTVSGSGRSQNISIVNGKMSSSFTFSYYLYPKKTGEFTIPPVSVRYGGKTFSTNPLKIKVVESRERAFASPSQRGGTGQKMPDIFVESEVDKTKAFVGEQITYTFRLFRRVRLLRNPSYQAPDFSGFIVEDLPPNKNYRTNVNGYEYIVTEVKYGLFPVKSGEIAIGRSKIEVTVDDIFSSDDFFDSFFSTGKRKVLASDPLNIKVLPLPAGKPDRFSGGVGVFDLQAELEKNSVRQGEPVTLTVKISGRGDPRPIEAPNLEGLTNFRVYETVSSVDISKDNYIVRGAKIFKTPVIPQISGEVVIPSFEFAYFDIEKKEYKILRSKPLILNVKPSKKSVQSETAPVSSQLQVVREDIRYIKDKPGKKAEKPIYRIKGFWYFQGIPLYLWIVSIAYSIARKKVIAPRYPDYKKKRKIKELLQQARKAAAGKDGQEVYRKITEVSRYAGSLPDEARDILKRAESCVYSPDKKDADMAEKDLKSFIKIVKKGLKILIFVMLCASLNTGADTGLQEQFKKANEYYKNGEYSDARNEYHSIIRQYGFYSGVCYNLGNTYWRLGEMGEARLYWEKALKINPGDSDTLYNIGILKKLVKEKEDEGTLRRFLVRTFSNNFLVIITSAAGWLFALLMLAFYWKRREGLAWSGITFGVLFIIFLGLTVVRVNAGKYQYGVIVKKARIHSAPGRETAATGTVGEGRKVYILNGTQGWFEVGIAEENLKFWIEEKKIERI